ENRMAVGRDLRRRECNLLGAPRLSQNESVPLVNRYPTAEIGQGKGALTVAAVGCSNQLKQCFVLRNRKQLTFAKHPPGWGEVSSEHSDLTYVWLCHCQFSFSLAMGRCPVGRCRTTA